MPRFERSCSLGLSLNLSLYIPFHPFALPFSWFCDSVYFVKVSSLHQYPGVQGKVCNCSMPSEENDPHCLCVASLGKSCTISDGCEECHDWSDDRCRRVREYMHKLFL